MNQLVFQSCVVQTETSKLVDKSFWFGVTNIKITKIDDERISLNLNPKHDTKEPRQEHKG
jgi:hypothetical protein